MMGKVMTSRTVLVFNEDDSTWVEKNFEDLASGNIFRIMDGDERYTNEKTGDNVWIAVSSAYKNDHGIWSVRTLY